MPKYLSQLAGGGHAFTPAMMFFNDAGYYSDSSFTCSGNQFTVCGRFTFPGRVGAGSDYFAVIDNGTSNSRRMILAVLAEDHTHGGKLQFWGLDSGGGTAFSFIYPDRVDDGLIKNFWLTVDTDAEQGLLVINGDDSYEGTVNNVNLNAGSGFNFDIGEATTFSSTEFNGSLGCFGYKEEYDENWQDYQFPDGSFKPGLDFSDWMVGNVHGDLENNEGTGSDFTRNGKIVVSDLGNGPHPLLGLDTTGDAVAGNIASPTTAWVNGLPITGSAFESSDIILVWDFRGDSGSYIPDIVDADYAHPDIGFSETGEWEFDGNNFLYPEDFTPTADPRLTFNNVPDPAGYRGRQWSLFGYGNDGTPNGTMDLNINSVSGSNKVFIRLANTNGEWVLYIYTVTEGSTTLRDSFSLNTNIENCLWNLIVQDLGDFVGAYLIAWELDSSNILDAGEAHWNESSRSNKSEANFDIDFEAAQSIGISKLVVMDI